MPAGIVSLLEEMATSKQTSVEDVACDNSDGCVECHGYADDCFVCDCDCYDYVEPDE